MKSFTIAIVSVFCVFAATAQTKDTTPIFKNAGEQEDYGAKQLFEGNYLKQHFERYKGKIIKVNDHTFRYGDKTLLIEVDSPQFRGIFETGIFYPAIISGDGPAWHKTAKEIEAMSPGEKVSYDFGRDDTLAIYLVGELKFLRMPTCRRFRLLQFHFALNPELCYMELTNDKATSDTPDDLFIRDAIVTYFKKHSMLL